MLEKLFKLQQNKTTIRTEVVAGITTFMTMAYILIVNPLILGDAGMDMGGVFVATAISAAIATVLMALLTNYSVALASGMGLNAYFAYVVVLNMGYTWQQALTAVFVSGVIFTILSFSNLREGIIKAIPMNLKYAVSVGIGLFIAFIGFQNANIVIADEATLLALGNLKDPTVLLALFGILLTGFLLHKGIKGALLLGILGTYIIGVITGNASLPHSLVSLPPSIKPVFFKFDFSNIFSLDMLLVIFAFLFVDLFDTVGTLIGVTSKAGYLDEEGNLPKAKEALLSDAIGTIVGACLGTSTVTSYIESASGVNEGGRTGLTGLVTAGFFLLALVFSPILLVIPGYATAPALIIVGLMMMTSILKITFDDYTESLPAFLTIILTPLAYSISEGLMFGILSYMILKICDGKIKEIHPVMYFIAILFSFKFIF